MNSNGSIHAHPEQRHRNKKHYNRKSGIPNSKKMWDHRDSLFVYRKAYAYWLNRFHKSFGPQGSNVLENAHSLLKKLLKWLRYTSVGINKLPAILAVQKLAVIYRRLVSILETNSDRLDKYRPQDRPVLQEMYQLVDKIRGFNDINESYDETGHSLLYFEKASRDIDDYLQGFNWEESIDKKTRISFSDKELIWQYIDEHCETLEKNNGLLTNEKLLKKIAKEVKKDLTPYEIRELIKTYWYDDDETTDSEDDDEDSEDEDMHDLGRLSSKQKKYSKLS